MRAKVVEAEAQIPLAIAEAFRSGNLGVMDYYRIKNIQADTEMRGVDRRAASTPRHDHAAAHAAAAGEIAVRDIGTIVWVVICRSAVVAARRAPERQRTARPQPARRRAAQPQPAAAAPTCRPGYRVESAARAVPPRAGRPGARPLGARPAPPQRAGALAPPARRLPRRPAPLAPRCAHAARRCGPPVDCAAEAARVRATRSSDVAGEVVAGLEALRRRAPWLPTRSNDVFDLARPRRPRPLFAEHSTPISPRSKRLVPVALQVDGDRCCWRGDARERSSRARASCGVCCDAADGGAHVTPDDVALAVARRARPAPTPASRHAASHHAARKCGPKTAGQRAFVDAIDDATR